MKSFAQVQKLIGWTTRKSYYSIVFFNNVFTIFGFLLVFPYFFFLIWEDYVTYKQVPIVQSSGFSPKSLKRVSFFFLFLRKNCNENRLINHLLLCVRNYLQFTIYLFFVLHPNIVDLFFLMRLRMKHFCIDIYYFEIKKEKWKIFFLRNTYTAHTVQIFKSDGLGLLVLAILH